MSFIDYIAHFREIAPSVLFKPLTNIPHNRTKSNCAWIEAAYAGGVCLGPDWEEWQVPGMVNYTGIEDCIDKLERLIKDREWRKQCFDASVNHIKENFLLSNVVFRPEKYGL
jgi:hypothetical protein